MCTKILNLRRQKIAKSKKGKSAQKKNNSQGSTKKGAGAQKSGGASGSNKTALVAVAVVAALIAVILIVRSTQSGGAGNTAFAEDKDPIKGAKDAPVLIQEFADFGCPHCRDARSMIVQVMNKYTGKVKVEFENMVLPSSKWSEQAAIASECAFKQSEEKYWVFSDLVFDAQDSWAQSPNTDFLETYAKQAKLDVKELKACAGTAEMKKKVDIDHDEALSLNINSTPTFFINGERFVGSSYPEMEAMVGAALEKAEK